MADISARTWMLTAYATYPRHTRLHSSKSSQDLLEYKLLSPLGAKPEDDNITRSASARIRLSIILHWTSEPDIAEEVGIF